MDRADGDARERGFWVDVGTVVGIIDGGIASVSGATGGEMKTRRQCIRMMTILKVLMHMVLVMVGVIAPVNVIGADASIQHLRAAQTYFTLYNLVFFKINSLDEMWP